MGTGWVQSQIIGLNRGWTAFLGAYVTPTNTVRFARFVADNVVSVGLGTVGFHTGYHHGCGVATAKGFHFFSAVWARSKVTILGTAVNSTGQGFSTNIWTGR